MNKKLMLAALAASTLLPWAAQAQDAQAAPKALTRAEVVAELQRARASGEYERIHSDAPEYLIRTQQAQARTRMAEAAEKAQPATKQ